MPIGTYPDKRNKARQGYNSQNEDNQANEYVPPREAVSSDPALHVKTLESLWVAKDVADRAALDELADAAIHGRRGKYRRMSYYERQFAAFLVFLQKRDLITSAAIASNVNPLGHTREPRYGRGQFSAIDRDHGAFVFPDANAHFLGEKPDHVYSVRLRRSS